MRSTGSSRKYVIFFACLLHPYFQLLLLPPLFRGTARYIAYRCCCISSLRATSGSSRYLRHSTRKRDLPYHFLSLLGHWDLVPSSNQNRVL
jgi:hypothetical protein